MLKSIVVFLFSIFTLCAQADQQAILSKEEAEKTIAFLEGHHQIILYCGCCSNDTRTKVVVSRISSECESSNWCEVRIEGVEASTQKEVNETIDLAYAWVNVNGVAKNLAWEIGLNADPCTPSFDWETYEPIHEASKETYDKSDAKAFQAAFKSLKKSLESETGFTLETFESKREFVVEKVTLTANSAERSVVVSQVGETIEHRYTIPLNKIELLTKNTEGIEFKTLKDGVVMVEEFVDSELKYRSFYLGCTVPIPNVSEHHLKQFEILVKSNASMAK